MSSGVLGLLFSCLFSLSCFGRLAQFYSGPKTESNKFIYEHNNIYIKKVPNLVCGSVQCQAHMHFTSSIYTRIYKRYRIYLYCCIHCFSLSLSPFRPFAWSAESCMDCCFCHCLSYYYFSSPFAHTNTHTHTWSVYI